MSAFYPLDRFSFPTNSNKRKDPLSDELRDKGLPSRICFTDRSDITFHKVVAVPMLSYSCVILTVNRSETPVPKVKWQDVSFRASRCVQNQLSVYTGFEVLTAVVGI
jgi:hypothetical protein